MSTDSGSRPFPLSSPLFTTPLPNLDYYGECRPAGDRGSDFFEFVPLEDGALSLCVGEEDERAAERLAFYARVDPALRQLSWRNSRESALVVRKKPFHVFHLRTEPDERRMPLQPGDILVAYTSGVGLAVQETEVIAVIQENSEARAGTLVAGILEAAARVPQDRTVLAVRLIGTEEPALAEEASELTLAVA
jgi:hypothetical protein